MSPEVVSMSGLKESRANEAKTTKLFSMWSRLAMLEVVDVMGFSEFGLMLSIQAIR